MKPGHPFEYALVRTLAGVTGLMPERMALGLGARLGDLARVLGIRRRVAEENLARAFPELAPEARARILRDSYRELGRVAIEYPRIPRLMRHPERVRVEGAEHLRAVAALDSGAIMLTGHHGNFELGGAWFGLTRPVDFVVKPLSNRFVDRWVDDLRARAGVGRIPLGAGIRGVFKALDARHWVALLADQDAREAGVFVPFFGRLSSTPKGPAEIAVRRGVPIMMGFFERAHDGTRIVTILPPLWPRTDVADPVLELTARHTALLEARIRERPDHWFWLHKRWKTAPPSEGGTT